MKSLPSATGEARCPLLAYRPFFRPEAICGNRPYEPIEMDSEKRSRDRKKKIAELSFDGQRVSKGRRRDDSDDE
ncbi:hypothetical protein GCM10009039_03890 [Halocalculus aciditolerans]|uniref:Uncharacterized protein n=1 Tax=Halocalculus aciditolerans TaxID=1383812 RepID=A0A830EZX1_9EURY|nr:hypothetical protein GCM10009039_03890 [Halocalculus aciditolerans]